MYICRVFQDIDAPIEFYNQAVNPGTYNVLHLEWPKY